MFTADLSWREPGTETVGQRRERKARERGSAANSTITTRSARSSISAERDLSWTSSFKKAKSLTPNILRPSSNRSHSSQKTVKSSPKDSNIVPSQELKDPSRQPSWTYASAIPPILPSGGSFDLQIQDVPELDGDSSSRRTNSTEPRLSYERRWEVRTPPAIEIVDEVDETSPQSPGTFVTGRTRASSVATQRGQVKSMPHPDLPLRDKRSSRSLKVQGALSMEALKLHEALQEVEDPRDLKRSAIESVRTYCPPITEWECLTPMRNPQEMRLSQKPTSRPTTAVRSSTTELTHFQRFIRRMENAGPKIILDRLTEDWQAHPHEGTEEEMALEKQLWLLTGFHMQNLRTIRVAPEPFCDTGRILELYGNLSEVFQASAMYPRQSIHFLTTKPQRPLTLPSNVSYLTIREFGAVPLPYPEGYFSHIRASNLPSLVPSAKFPELFHECFKLLAPGGLLEIRVMDAAPARKTMGPLLRSWIEDRLSTNLERLFRCSKPCSLVPSWLAEAGFELAATMGESSIMLPTAFDGASSDIDMELCATIGRALWKDVWGSFVEGDAEEPQWWWDDQNIVRECLERKTMFECRAICAYKK